MEQLPAERGIAYMGFSFIVTSIVLVICSSYRIHISHACCIRIRAPSEPLFCIGRGKVTLRAAGSDLCRCRSNLARAQFRATGQRDGGHATTCTPAGAPRVQLRRPEESAPKSCRAATHGKPLSSVGPQRSRFLTLFHHSDRRRQERLHGLDRPSAGAGRPRASMPGTVRRVVPFSSEADRSNGGTLASPLSRPCRARRP